MSNRQIFSLIWKINAVLILTVGLLATILLSIGLWTFLKEVTATRQVRNVANTSLENEDQTKTTLGKFEQVGSTLRAELSTDQNYSFGSSDKTAYALRNYLFFDPQTNQARWLKPSMDSIILSTTCLPKRKDDTCFDPPQLFVYEIVEKDTNGDERLSESDLKSLAISDPQGQHFKTILQAVDHVNYAALLSPDRLLILYTAKTKLRRLQLNPRNPTQTQDREVLVPRDLP